MHGKIKMRKRKQEDRGLSKEFHRSVSNVRAQFLPDWEGDEQQSPKPKGLSSSYQPPGCLSLKEKKKKARNVQNVQNALIE